MSSSWSDALGRLAGPLGLSLVLHVTAGAVYHALPLGLGSVARQVNPQRPPRLLALIQSDSVPLPLPLAAPAPHSVQYVPPVATAPAPAPSEQSPQAQEPPARYFTSRELDAKPIALTPVEPAYPNDAYLRGIDGSVQVRLQLSETGAVEEAVVLRADPPGYFEEPVRLAFLAAKFSPGMRAGKPVRVRMTVEVRYRSPLLDAVPAPASPGG